VPEGMSLCGAMLSGHPGSRLAWLIEGVLTAPITSALARLGVADELADGPLTDVMPWRILEFQRT
jgi:hypothetical protein